MKIWLRPLILVTIISFLLGFWVSLRKTEKYIVNRLKVLPEIVLMTDQSELWSNIVPMAERSGIAHIKLLKTPRRLWKDTLLNSKNSCDLVAMKSYFVSEFVSHRWLAPIGEQNREAWESLHADFRTLNDIQPEYFLPLSWAVTAWDEVAEGAGGLQLKSSLDDALSVALDQQNFGDEEETEDADANAEQLWQSVKGQIQLSLNSSDYDIPIAPIHAVQRSQTIWDGSSSPSPPLNSRNLWLYGLASCTHHNPSVDVGNFLNWLSEPEVVSALYQSSQLASTFSTADHLSIIEARPSNLRSFPLGSIRSRGLPWDLAVAWEDLLKPVPNHEARR